MPDVRQYNDMYSGLVDPVIMGYDSRYWYTSSGTPAVVGSALRFTSAAAYSKNLYRYGRYDFLLNVPVAPTAGHARRWGLAPAFDNTKGGVFFDIDGTTFSAKSYSNDGTEQSTTLTWDSSYTAAQTKFSITWMLQNVDTFTVSFLIGNRMVARHTVIGKDISLPVIISNGVADNLDLSAIYFRGVNKASNFFFSGGGVADEVDPLSLHLDQTSQQTVTGGVGPLLSTGFGISAGQSIYSPDPGVPGLPGNVTIDLKNADADWATSRTLVLTNSLGGAQTNLYVYGHGGFDNNVYINDGFLGIGVDKTDIWPDYNIEIAARGTGKIGKSRSTGGTFPSVGSDVSLLAGGSRPTSADLAGGNAYLVGGISTGTGTSGVYLQTATAGSTGTSDNTPTTKMHILGNSIYLDALATAGLVRAAAGTGLLSIDTSTYLTAEADTLASVTGRGATTATALTISAANPSLTLGSTANAAGLKLIDSVGSSHFAATLLVAKLNSAAFNVTIPDWGSSQSLVGGTGTAKQVPIFSAASIVGGDAGFTYDTATGTLKVGKNSLSGILSLYAECGATDYAVAFTPSASTTQSYTLTLPTALPAATYPLVFSSAGVGSFVAGISASVTTAALTPGGTQGSMTFVSGVLTAQTQAT